MTLVEALAARINNLLVEKNMTLYRLAENSGMYYASLRKITGEKNLSANLITLMKIANGFEMTVSEFLNDKMFNDFAKEL